MNRPLTFLMPVRDSQSTLAANVNLVLEMAADLSDRFELVLIDDGSSDATPEMARELSRSFPQIRTLRLSTPLGEDAALRVGFAQSHADQGDVVFVRGGSRPTFERVTGAVQPARPNYLGRTRTFARKGL